MTIAPSNATSDDQILQHGNDESAIDIKMQRKGSTIPRHRQISDGLHFYDPALIHPIVHKLSCCPELTYYYKDDNMVEAEMR